MTLKTRNSFIIITLSVAAVVTLTAVAGLLFVHIDRADPNLFPEALPPVISAALGCLLGVGVQYYFRKTLSAEITLFIVFIALMSFDALKPAMLILRRYDLPVAWSTTLTRAVYLFRFAGIFCFLAAGLFASGLPTQRLSITLGVCFFIAFTFAVIVPIDSSIREDNLLYRLGMQRDIKTALVSLEVIAVINYFTAALRNNEKNYSIAALGAACALGGRELLFFHHSLLHTGVGIVLFGVGTVLFADRIHRIYLWK